MMGKVRLDLLLVQRGLFDSRERARRAVMAGQVEVGGQRVDKAGTQVPADAELRALGPKEPYVSRAGRKLAHALDHFSIAPRDLVCMDVGASTGGFTDCLLQRGARRVYAIDVGYGQLDHGLRTDRRVIVMERVNARYLEPDAIDERCGLVTVDVSFISVLKIVPALRPHIEADGQLLVMLKPQFEVGRRQVGKGGVVRDAAVRDRVLADRVRELAAMGWVAEGPVDSSVAGVRGNLEAFVRLRPAPGGEPQ